MSDDFIRFVGMSAIHLLQEIKKLEEEQKKLKETQNRQRDWITSILEHPFRTIFRRIFKKN